MEIKSEKVFNLARVYSDKNVKRTNSTKKLVYLREYEFVTWVFQGEKSAIDSKPCFIFSGAEFEQKEDFSKFANLLLGTLFLSLSLCVWVCRCGIIYLVSMGAITRFTQEQTCSEDR
jgi:hypothetical protein